MSNGKLLHNPRCSKSRQTLQLLNDKNIDPEIVLYLETPPSEAELKKIITLLQIKPRDLLRKKEAEYKENNLADENLSDKEIIKLMTQFPKLIERPIYIKGDKAVVGRPPENVLQIV